MPRFVAWSLWTLVLGIAGCSSDAPQGRERANEEVDEQEDDDAAAVDAAVSKDAAAPRDAKAATDPKVDSAVNTPEPVADSGSTRDAAQVVDATVRDAGAVADAGSLERFSFFVASLSALRELSNNQNGFGGDLRFGETGDGAGLRGADKICTTIAEQSMPGSSAKNWRAFLSATKGGASGGPVHAIERIGSGPWYDRLGRVVGMTKADLLQNRPNADNAIKNDLPNEDGVPNHNPDGTGQVDNHHVLTGSNPQGQLYANDVRATCNDWTKADRDMADAPRVGLSWPRGGGGGGGGASSQQWISAMDESGCAPGVSISEMGGPVASNPTVGSGGGYGAIYCFALIP